MRLIKVQNPEDKQAWSMEAGGGVESNHPVAGRQVGFLDCPLLLARTGIAVRE